MRSRPKSARPDIRRSSADSRFNAGFVFDGALLRGIPEHLLRRLIRAGVSSATADAIGSHADAARPPAPAWSPGGPSAAPKP